MTNTKYNQFRNIYINNLVRREYPILPAYFFYLEHTSNKQILDQESFHYLFMKGVSDTFNQISLEVKPAQMDIEEIMNILNNYYNVQELYDSKGELIKFV